MRAVLGLPFTGADIAACLKSVQQGIQAAFAELAKGRTVIMIAHRLSTVADADRIFVIEDGKVAESGTRTELCAAGGLFAKMWSDYQASVEWKVAKEG